MEQNLDPHGIRPPKARSCGHFQGQLFKNENSFEEWKLEKLILTPKSFSRKSLKMRIPLRSGNFTCEPLCEPLLLLFKNENSFEEWKLLVLNQLESYCSLFKNENSFEEWKPSNAPQIPNICICLKMRIPLRSGNFIKISDL